MSIHLCVCSLHPSFRLMCVIYNYSTLYLCRYCSKMEQLFLQAVTAEIQRTGVEETVFEKVYVQLKTLCIFDGK